MSGKNFIQIGLVAINIIFFMCGLVLVASGVYLKHKNDFLNGELKELFNNLVLEEGGVSVATTLLRLSNLFIAIGLVIVIISFVGGCGAVFQYRVLLGVYTIAILAMVVVVVIGVILAVYARNQDSDMVYRMMKKELGDTYRGSYATDPLSISWNFLFFHLQCCGVESFKDLKNASHWNKTNEFKTPLYCCQGIKDFYNLTPPVGDNDWNCARHPTHGNSNFKRGCADVILHWIYVYQKPMIISGIVVLVVLVLCCAFSIKMLTNIGENEYAAIHR